MDANLLEKVDCLRLDANRGLEGNRKADLGQFMTPAPVAQLMASLLEGSHPEVRLILKVNPANEGLGNNYAEAAFLGHGTWYRLVCGDNVEPKETLVKVFSQTGKADLIIPYRPDESSRSGFRQLVSQTFTWLVNFTSGHHIRYYNGLPLTRRYYVMRWHSNAHGFGFQADLITRLLDRGVSYLEIPVEGHERAAGKSTALTLRNLGSVAHSLLTLVIRRMSKLVYGRS